MNIDLVLKELTLEEKAALVSGTNNMYTNPVPRLNIGSVSMADGPHGLRKQLGGTMDGIADAAPATAFPTAVATASGWNPHNLTRMGEAIGKECRHYGVHILLGPGVNIKRNPLCGRNFEYFSEDPLLSGTMGVAEVQGVKSQGVDVSVKHFALNSNENYRYMGNSVADHRAMREIYLRCFEQIVREAKPATLMCAYNQVLGEFCSENPWLLTKVLREDWGFEGLVMTDWGATHDRVKGIEAGLDLEMPGDTAICRKWIIDGVRNGQLSEESLNKAVRNVLKLVDSCVKELPTVEVDWEAHHRLSASIAADCAVLLKNDGVLPLKGTENLLIIGQLFENMRYQGAGSSMINATKVTSPMDAFEEASLPFTYCPGYDVSGVLRTDWEQEALQKAASTDTILVFLGLTDESESEGRDRPHMALPENQLHLMEALRSTGKQVICVLFGGSVVELPFLDQCAALLHMFLPGQNGGTATRDLLFGAISPSGRLSETWPLTYSDVPFGGEYVKGATELYKESVFVGYRYYETAGKAVRFPFGYGLGYSTFRWENMTAEDQGDTILVTCSVTNTGFCHSGEVVELYVSPPANTLLRPLRELVAFKKVYLSPGETEKVELTVPKSSLRYFHTGLDTWAMEAGDYALQLCRDAHTPLLVQTLSLTGDSVPAPYTPRVMEVYKSADLSGMTDKLFSEMSGLPLPQDPPALPIHMESRFSDLKLTFPGRIIHGCVMLAMVTLPLKKARRLPDGPHRDNQIKGIEFLGRAMETNSIRAMSMAAGQILPYNIAQALVALANGHILRAIRLLMQKISVPRLPKDA